MKEVNHRWSQGIGFEIRVDAGVSDEKRLECEKAIADILLQDNDVVAIHPVGYCTYGFKKVVHEYKK